MITTKKLKPLILTCIILILDQITKFMIVKNIPIHTIGESYFNGLVRIIHTRNLAIAFSMGNSLPNGVRYILFTIIPIAVLVGLLIYFLKGDDFTNIQRWAVAGILGGGIGNLIDRVFRPLGVVDFIDVKFFGIFGMERWPTFNVADSTVVISGLVLLFAFIIEDLRRHE